MENGKVRKMKSRVKFSKRLIYIAVGLVLTGMAVFLSKTGLSERLFKEYKPNWDILPGPGINLAQEYLEVEKIDFPSDRDGDGINDLDDIVEGARKDAENKPRYRSRYYSGGYPPENEGVCTDVIWRALLNAGYNLKEMMDEDIRKNPQDYPGVSVPDPNIDFRRVKNQLAFFKKYAESLTLELVPGDPENLKQWQGGDIVTFDNPEHIGILSTKRNKYGVPYLIHNAGPYTREADDLMDWYDGITGHFRFPKLQSQQAEY